MASDSQIADAVTRALIGNGVISDPCEARVYVYCSSYNSTEIKVEVNADDTTPTEGETT